MFTHIQPEIPVPLSISAPDFGPISTSQNCHSMVAEGHGKHGRNLASLAGWEQL